MYIVRIASRHVLLRLQVPLGLERFWLYISRHALAPCVIPVSIPPRRIHPSIVPYLLGTSRRATDKYTMQKAELLQPYHKTLEFRRCNSRVYRLLFFAAANHAGHAAATEQNRRLYVSIIRPADRRGFRHVWGSRAVAVRAVRERGGRLSFPISFKHYDVDPPARVHAKTHTCYSAPCSGTASPPLFPCSGGY